MTPRTRISNKDANYKVYYSKNVAQQVHFPHKRKTVRRPLGAANDGSDKRQMKFLPEKMRIERVNTVGDSEEDEKEDEDEDVEEGRVSIKPEPEDESNERHEYRGQAAKGRGKKRRSDAAETHDEDNDESVRPIPKRRRQAAALSSSRRQSRQIKVESAEEDNAGPDSSEQKRDRSRTLRRQSTMTQLVEGRRPLSDTEEPAFKPVKRTPRLSWGGQSKKGKDKKQRTLTQMVPGMKLMEIESDDDLQGLSDAEAEERDSQAYGEAIAARLAQESLIQKENNKFEEAMDRDEGSSETQSQENNDKATRTESADRFSGVPSLVVRSVEDSDDEDDEESYQPTQFIDAPVTRSRRSRRRTSAIKQRVPQVAKASTTTEQTTRKSRFSLLSTPDKRRIREIPSSQSPADSPLSTQVSPSKASRPPLTERSSNNAQGTETPSKRKQVTFHEPTKEPNPPPSLRKFKSVIQDSEDEDDDLFEIDENNDKAHVDEHPQPLINRTDSSSHGIAVGAETQAMLDQIDQACADRGDEVVQPSRGSSEVLGMSTIYRGQYEPSPELGEQNREHVNIHEDLLDVHSPYRSAYVGIKQEQPYATNVPGPFTQGTSLEVRMSPSRDDETANTSIELPLVFEQVPSSPPVVQQTVEDTCPSTPMVIIDSSDEEDELYPPPSHQNNDDVPQPSSTTLQHSADLDGEPVQVLQSPPTQQQTQQSHSSKAEQQLHNEWFSYSQYVNARPPQSSSMNVAHDKFSYHATPMPPRPVTQTQSLGHYTSQATTVDEVTPRKNRTQRTMSANTTPRKMASSQPFSSPSKPPPLFIPSSFPSPAKARMEEWSSPLLGNTQVTYGVGASLEDFSIPLPPPVEDDWFDGV
jgi:hypothetical protein